MPAWSRYFLIIWLISIQHYLVLISLQLVNILRMLTFFVNILCPIAAFAIFLRYTAILPLSAERCVSQSLDIVVR